MPARSYLRNAIERNIYPHSQQRFAQFSNDYQARPSSSIKSARPASTSVRHDTELEKQSADVEKSSPQLNPTVLLRVVARSRSRQTSATSLLIAPCHCRFNTTLRLGRNIPAPAITDAEAPALIILQQQRLTLFHSPAIKPSCSDHGEHHQDLRPFAKRGDGLRGCC